MMSQNGTCSVTKKEQKVTQRRNKNRNPTYGEEGTKYHVIFKN